jgi:formiminoglutamase
MIELFSKEEANQYITQRAGETKLGETLIMPYGSLHETLAKFNGNYVIIGVPEDIGPRANMGKKGARNAWPVFLKSFLNVQHNEYFDSNEILILGHLPIDDLLNTADQLDANIPAELDRLRELVAIIDERLTRVIKAIVSENKIPIVIGGGHNNAYGIIEGTVVGKQEGNENISRIGVVNLDPHADIRALEGRHSGNAFSYAFERELLQSYHVIGLQENYNSSATLEKFKKHSSNFSYTTLEAIIDNETSIADLVNETMQKMGELPVGIEIDFDSIEQAPSSAKTPSGWQVNDVRKFIRLISKHKNLAYLHLTEAAPESVENDTFLVGKILSFLVTDFVKINSKVN